MRGEQVIYLENRIFCFDKKQIKPKDRIIRMGINIKIKPAFPYKNSDDLRSTAGRLKTLISLRGIPRPLFQNVLGLHETALCRSVKRQ